MIAENATIPKMIAKLTIAVLLAFCLIWGCGQVASNNDDAVSVYSSSARFGFVISPPLPAGFSDLGTGWIRPHPGPFIWNSIESQEGTYDFSLADAGVELAQDAGLHIIGTIWPFSDWDQAVYTQEAWWQTSPGFRGELDPAQLPESRYKPNDFVAYGNFVQAVVERYDGDGVADMTGLRYGIKHWEVLNEPELRDEDLVFFRGYPGQTTAEAYLEILITSEAKIHEADPDAKVVLAGAAGAEDLTQELFGELFSLDQDSHFDIASTHSINNGETLTFDGYTSFLSQESISAPIWITEISFGSGDHGMTDAGETYISDEAQAEMLVRSYVYGFGLGLEKIFYTTYQEKHGMSERMASESLIDENGDKRSSYYALQTLIDKIDLFTTVEAIAESQYKFTVSGSPVYVLWGEVGLPAEISGEVTVTDISGTVATQEASQIVLSQRPIFVE